MDKRLEVTRWKGMIGHHPQWAIRAALKVYDNHMLKEEHYTKGIGFNSYDAEIIKEIVEKYKASGDIGYHELCTLYQRMPKYAGQIFETIKGEKSETRDDRHRDT